MDTRLLSEAEALLVEYEEFLRGKMHSTFDAYIRVLRQLLLWIVEWPGCGGDFYPEQLTKTAMEIIYLAYLEQSGSSIAHRARVKSAVSGFARWLIEEKGILPLNPTRGLNILPQALLAPRQLSTDERYILRNLIEQDGHRRSHAVFALGYWAGCCDWPGCRVSDVSWLRMEHT